MRTIAIGARTGFQIKNANLIGFLIKIYGIGSAVNVDPVDVPFKARISAKLRQAGFNETVLDGTITALAKGTAPRNQVFKESDTEGYRVVAVAAGAVVGILEWTYKILFPTVINLNGDDVMDVEIDFASDSLTNHNVSTSYIGIKEIDGVGSQFYIPKVKEIVLPSLETKHEVYLGDNILRAVFVGAATHAPAEDGLTKVEIFSDRRNYTMDPEEIALEGINTQHKTVCVIDQEHDQVKIKSTMDGTLNAAGDLRLVVTDYYINQTLAALGANRANKHKQALAAKI